MKTKIIATLGPASSGLETMRGLAKAGVRIFRLNFSHGSADSFTEVMDNVRSLEKELGLTLTAMADLSGPKIRIGDLYKSPAHIIRGDRLVLGPEADRMEHEGGRLYLPFEDTAILKDLAKGDTVLLSDGMVELTVTSVLKPCAVELKAHNNGLITSHKGIAFPGKFFSIPALTEKDRVDLEGALKLGVDAAAMSFVQTKQDIVDLRRAMEECGRVVPIIAKMEQKAAYDNLETILDVADGLMVARGDLGVQCPLPDLPIMQKQIIDACRRRDKPVIVATQMLISMVDNPAPTRPETTDVANAILDGADVVMLSEETAIGKHPVEAVAYMARIADKAEGYGLQRSGGPLSPGGKPDPERTLAYCACLLAEQTRSAALICHTRSGTTAQRVSGRRPVAPIHALTPRAMSRHLLNFSWGVIPHHVDRDQPSHLARCQHFVEQWSGIQPGQSVVITAGQKTPGREDLHTNEVKVYYKG
ncbi:pyruvate kinase [Salidesulfovibrio onnuriiensis]|uniref:pyruvate kinase n=1 Tax=Salidesulfovibrio onnuriiensis TaxID=2583823 RepID=UPI0011C8C076|nr:pyruvate kinase [Salidesulfovibrio onnuriiensis]